jgi:hypothetical protein
MATDNINAEDSASASKGESPLDAMDIVNTSLLRAKSVLSMAQGYVTGDHTGGNGNHDEAATYMTLGHVEKVLKKGRDALLQVVDVAPSVPEMLNEALSLLTVLRSSYLLEHQTGDGKVAQVYNDEITSGALWSLQLAVEDIEAAFQA